METLTIIKTVSILISIIAPVLCYIIFKAGIEKSDFTPETKVKLKNLLITSLIIWVSTIYTLTLAGSFEHDNFEIFPKFLYGLLLPVVLVLSLFASSTFRTVLDHLSYKLLSLGQVWRILGAIFFLIAISGIGPYEFVNSGIGDVLTGLTAIQALIGINRAYTWRKGAMWALVALGMTDLLIVLFILLTRYPIWSDELPSTAMAGAFPMMLIIGIAAPMALLLHIFMLRKLLKKG